MTSIAKRKHHIKKKAVNYTEILMQRRKIRERKIIEPEATKAVIRLSETILEGFEVLWRQCILCDVVIISTNKTFHAHKLVLVACSDYFYDLFVVNLHQSREVHLPNIASDVMSAILQCMYTGKINLSEENIENILSTSSSLGFYLIQDTCEDFLVEHTNAKNCLKMLDRSFRFGLNRLSEKALCLCATYFSAVCRRPQFKNIPIDQIVALLKRDELDVGSELDVYHCMMDWIEHQRLERLIHAPALMGTLRLPLLEPSVIIDSIESVTYLMDIPECQHFVKEALHYHCVPSRQSVLQSSRTVPRNRTKSLCVLSTGGAPRLKTDIVCDEVRMYNVQDNTWDIITYIPEPRHHHAVAVLGGFLYIAGGEMKNDHCSPVNDVFRYDPRFNRWLKVANMLYNRQSFQMAILNNFIYAIGGRVNKTESLSSVERYNPQLDQWEEVAPLSCPKRCVAVATLNSRIYAVGGSGNRVISSRVECYSPSLNKWETRKSIFTPRFFAHLVPISDSLLLIGGATINAEGGIKCVDVIEQYNPTTDTWVSVATMKTPRAEFGCSVLEQRVYIAGGYSWDRSERLRSVECLNVDSLIWSDVANLEEPWTGTSCASIAIYSEKVSGEKQRQTKSSPHLPLARH